jgi:lipoprotein-anchoring transpeptidase ErfK/SrfK
VLLLALLLPVAACGRHSSKAEAPPETDATTETTVAADPWLTVIATATVPEVTVLEARPDTAVTATDAAVTAADGLAAIPRKELNSAGMAKTDDGYTYENPTYWGNPLVFVVTEDDGGEWLKVLLQARPNHTEGWIRRTDVTLSETRTHIELQKSTFHLKAWDGDRLVAEADVVIGKDATYTPVGTFYIAEKIAKEAGGAYGPWILALNGYSESLDSFDGGMPQLAFHGTNKPELIGTQASNGCVRMPDEVDQILADQMPAGTPITVTE